MEEHRSLRFRVNVSTSVKGIKTWDCTVDGTHVENLEEAAKDRAAILQQSDALVAELDRRYPAPTEA